MAIAMAALVNCENPLKDDSGKIVDACGICRNCHQILNLGFPELHIAAPIPPHKNEAESIDLIKEVMELKRNDPYKFITSNRQLTVPIDIARGIRRKCAIKPPENVKRVVIFYQMEKMLAASADSLLKLIEEPPPETIIILTAVNPEDLLPTIQSRAQAIAFRPLSVSDIAIYLATKYGVSTEKSGFFARLAEGSIGRALTFIEETDETPIRQLSFLMFKSVFAKDNPSAVLSIYELVNPNDRGEAEQILIFWQSFLSDMIVLNYGSDSPDVINTDFSADLERFAGQIMRQEDFCGISEHIKKTMAAVRRNAHLKPAMTALTLNIRKHINQST